MLDAKNLGKQIKEARKNKGITQVKLASMVNYANASAISKFETGKKLPSLPNVYETSGERRNNQQRNNKRRNFQGSELNPPAH